MKAKPIPAPSASPTGQHHPKDCREQKAVAWEFPKSRGTLFCGPFLIRILPFRVLY